MNYTRFIIKNTFRNKRRTSFTVLSIGFSLFLLIALATFLNVLLNPRASQDAATRVVVKRSTTLLDLLPIAYVQRIQKVPGVEACMPLQFFGGYYQDPRNFFANIAVDPALLYTLFPELQVSPQDREAFAKLRQGALVGVGLMRKYGWHVGQRVTLKGTFFAFDLEFVITGTYTSTADENIFYFHFDYLTEARHGRNAVSAIWVRARDAESVPTVIEKIDALFRNSSAETRTETEKAFQLGFVEMLGNIRALIGSIGAVVVFTMLLVAASTMGMTIRERTREVAILKAIGFPRRTVLELIVGESLLISLLGLIMAGVLAQSLQRMDLNALTMGFIPTFRPPLAVYLGALATACGIGLFAGLAPALQAARLPITVAMRRLE